MYKLKPLSGFRGYDYFSKVFKDDGLLEIVLLDFCEFTIVNILEKGDNFIFDVNSVGYDEYIEHFLNEGKVHKSKSIIEKSLDELIACGMLAYDVETPFRKSNFDATTDEKRISYYRQLGHPNSDSKLILTIGGGVDSTFGCTGAEYYKRVLKEKKQQRELEALEEDFEKKVIGRVRDNIDPDIKKTNEILASTERKLKEVENALRNSATKNVEVLSVFVAVLALLFSNAIGVSNYDKIGLEGIVIINASTGLCIIILLTFVELVINKEAELFIKMFVSFIFILILGCLVFNTKWIEMLMI